MCSPRDSRAGECAARARGAVPLPGCGYAPATGPPGPPCRARARPKKPPLRFALVPHEQDFEGISVLRSLLVSRNSCAIIEPNAPPVMMMDPSAPNGPPVPMEMAAEKGFRSATFG